MYNISDKIMNKELKEKILEMKSKLRRGDLARIVEKVEKYNIRQYDVYNIINGKSLVDNQKMILVLSEAKKCIDENQKFLNEFNVATA